jgi:phosphatidylinositol alpha 1,6-mannosyltransferase
MDREPAQSQRAQESSATARVDMLCPPDAQALADAVLELADSPGLRERLARRGRAAVGERTWERALERPADGYRRVLAADGSRELTRAA